MAVEVGVGPIMGCRWNKRPRTHYGSTRHIGTAMQRSCSSSAPAAAGPFKNSGRRPERPRSAFRVSRAAGDDEALASASVMDDTGPSSPGPSFSVTDDVVGVTTEGLPHTGDSDGDESENKGGNPFAKLWKKMSSDGARQKLKSLGSSALLSYGFVSNACYISAVIISWVITGRRTGLCPLANSETKATFGIVYAGLFALNNFIRPVRFSLSVVLAPSFVKLREFFAKTFKVSPRVSFAITVFLVNVCGTISYLVGGVTLASLIFRVPLLP